VRKLATIRRISDIQPIDGADRIEVATVNGWKVVVAKGVGHQIGDLVVYCEIDSFLPIRPEYEFLRKSSYKKMSDGSEGFRLRTVKLRGQVSQGLILPIRVFEDYGYGIGKDRTDSTVLFVTDPETMEYKQVTLGDDVSDLLDIVKYDPPLPAQLAGQAKGYFPSFIPKTDEERIQNLTEEYPEYLNSGKRFYTTEKLNGSSATFYLKDGDFGVCSRNLELKEDDKNTFWRVAREMKLEEKMSELGGNYAIQGELIGEGIQKNPYKIKGHTVRFFNVFDIDHQERVSLEHMGDIIISMGLETVPMLFDSPLPRTIDDLLAAADGKSELNPETDREGLVIRSDDQEISFKAISNQFLLNEK